MDAHELLDVEDEDERQERLGQLFTRVDRAGDKPPIPFESPAPTKLTAGASTPGPIEPPTELLDRVRQFLPEMVESNASLSSRDQRELDIENVNGDSRYIEMNLGLGVFEYRRQGTHSRSSASTSSSSMSECDSEESDSGSSGSSSCSEDGIQEVARLMKPLPRRAQQPAAVPSGSKNPAIGPTA